MRDLQAPGSGSARSVKPLIGGAVLLIVGAAVALAAGWGGAKEALMWTSIVASVAAVVLLSVGYYRTKAELARRRAPGSQPATMAGGSEQVRGAPQVAPLQRDPPPFGRVRAEGSEPVVPHPWRVELLSPHPSEPDPAPAEPAPAEQVVAFAARRRFHRAACRYASGAGGETLSRGAAIGRGDRPCAICNP